jgi:hypothetical protein
MHTEAPSLSGAAAGSAVTKLLGPLGHGSVERTGTGSGADVCRETPMTSARLRCKAITEPTIRMPSDQPGGALAWSDRSGARSLMILYEEPRIRGEIT